MLPPLPQRREQRQENDGDHQDFKVLLHPRNLAEPESKQSEYVDPRQTADHVVLSEAAVIHFADPGHERGEGSHDRNEPCHDDRAVAEFVEVLLGVLEMPRLEERDRAAEGSLADPTAE